MTDTIVDWLLASDPSIHWQVQRDLLDAPATAWEPVRRRVESEGWGARLLAHQDDDGLWAGGAFVPRGFDWSTIKTAGQPWTATCWSLALLREFGLPPDSASARRTVELVRRNGRWDHDGQPYWDGEVEECINGRTVAQGAYFGVDVTPIVDRLLGERQPDGGWNCERCNGSVRSSFDTTINVLEGLLAYEQATGGSDAVREARAAGEGYLLERGLWRRLRTGAAADEQFVTLLHPHRWRHDVLRGLDYFRASALHSGSEPDARLGDAIAIVRSKRAADGTWHRDWQARGAVWFEMDDGPGTPSPWLTLKALRVLRWWDGAHALS